MMTFIAVVHIIVAAVLIGLVLIQDSKGGGLGIGGGGGGSNSLLGATGATTLAAKATRWAAVVFALTCVGLSIMTSKKQKSVLDTVPVSAAPVTTVPAAGATAAPANASTPATTPGNSVPATAETPAAAPAAPAEKK